MGQAWMIKNKHIKHERTWLDKLPVYQRFVIVHVCLCSFEGANCGCIFAARQILFNKQYSWKLGAKRLYEWKNFKLEMGCKKTGEGAKIPIQKIGVKNILNHKVGAKNFNSKIGCEKVDGVGWWKNFQKMVMKNSKPKIGHKKVVWVKNYLSETGCKLFCNPFSIKNFSRLSFKLQFLNPHKLFHTPFLTF